MRPRERRRGWPMVVAAVLAVACDSGPTDPPGRTDALELAAAWVRSSPEEQGFDSGALQDAVADAFQRSTSAVWSKTRTGLCGSACLPEY
jgi:hypothetical protein